MKAKFIFEYQRSNLEDQEDLIDRTFRKLDFDLVFNHLKTNKKILKLSNDVSETIILFQIKCEVVYTLELEYYNINIYLDDLNDISLSKNRSYPNGEDAGYNMEEYLKPIKTLKDIDEAIQSVINNTENDYWRGV